MYSLVGRVGVVCPDSLRWWSIRHAIWAAAAAAAVVVVYLNRSPVFGLLF